MSVVPAIAVVPRNRWHELYDVICGVDYSSNFRISNFCGEMVCVIFLSASGVDSLAQNIVKPNDVIAGGGFRGSRAAEYVTAEEDEKNAVEYFGMGVVPGRSHDPIVLAAIFLMKIVFKSGKVMIRKCQRCSERGFNIYPLDGEDTLLMRIKPTAGV